MNKILMADKNQRHVRWSWEKSPDLRDNDGNDGVRYHFVVVDDRFRRGIMDKIIEPLSIHGGLELIRSVEGKVKGTKFRYLFESYDSLVKPETLQLHMLKRMIIPDGDLRERVRGNIEDYVSRVYS